MPPRQSLPQATLKRICFSSPRPVDTMIRCAEWAERLNGNHGSPVSRQVAWSALRIWEKDWDGRRFRRAGGGGFDDHIANSDRDSSRSRRRKNPTALGGVNVLYTRSTFRNTTYHPLTCSCLCVASDEHPTEIPQGVSSLVCTTSPSTNRRDGRLKLAQKCVPQKS